MICDPRGICHIAKVPIMHSIYNCNYLFDSSHPLRRMNLNQCDMEAASQASIAIHSVIVKLKHKRRARSRLSSVPQLDVTRVPPSLRILQYYDRRVLALLSTDVTLVVAQNGRNHTVTVRYIHKGPRSGSWAGGRNCEGPWRCLRSARAF